MKHPHAEIIKALADDDSLTLWFVGKDNVWAQYSGEARTKISSVAYNPETQFHLGPTPPPRMIETEYGSYPEPLREAPEQGAKTFLADIIKGGSIDLWDWTNSPYAHQLLRCGVLHLTREAAEQQAQVELKRRMAELGWEKS